MTKPEHAGGVVEIARAIYMSKDKIDSDKLLNYAVRLASQGVIKRLGFPLEILNFNHEIIDELQRIKTESHVLLATEPPSKKSR